MLCRDGGNGALDIFGVTWGFFTRYGMGRRGGFGGRRVGKVNSVGGGRRGPVVRPVDGADLRAALLARVLRFREFGERCPDGFVRGMANRYHRKEVKKGLVFE